MHENLFPEKVYNDSNFRVLIHNLHELAKSSLHTMTLGITGLNLILDNSGLMSKKQFGYLDKLINKTYG
ncbi:MAG: hypothetical protein IPI04_15360 [Ignavibacteria bacterium]|nr:hypothetical protein [Ignavibacteria bacterium]